MRSQGWRLAKGIRALVKETPQAPSLLLSREDTARVCDPEEGCHSTVLVSSSRTSSLQNCDKWTSVVSTLLSLYCFVIAARRDSDISPQSYDFIQSSQVPSKRGELTSLKRRAECSSEKLSALSKGTQLGRTRTVLSLLGRGVWSAQWAQQTLSSSL